MEDKGIFDTADLELLKGKRRILEEAGFKIDEIDFVMTHFKDFEIRLTGRLKAEVEKVLDVILVELEVENKGKKFIMDEKGLIRFVQNIKKRLGIK